MGGGGGVSQTPALKARSIPTSSHGRYAEALNTHAGQADALEGPVLKAVSAVLAQHRAIVPKSVLRELSKQQDLHSILKGTPNPKLRAFLIRPDQDIDASELSSLQGELAHEGARRRHLNREASSHFGVDGGVYAKDDHTLVVELVAPTPYFLELTTFYPFYPVPRWAIERSSRDWFMPGKVVGNGPYTLASWRVGDRIRLERSATYWGKSEVKLGSIDALSLENVTTGLNLYLTGEIDWLPHGRYPEELGPDLRRRPDFYVGPALIAYYYRINCTRKPFDDARVRKALNLAIDRTQIAKNVLMLGQSPALHSVPPGLRGYQSPESGISYDVPEARRLLAEAGFPDGKGFPKFGILYNTLEAHKKLAEVLADQLRRHLNINAVAYNQEWQSYLQSTRSMDYELRATAGSETTRSEHVSVSVGTTAATPHRLAASTTSAAGPASDVDRFVAAPEFLLEHAHDAQKLKALAERIQTTGEAAPRLAAMAELRMALLAEAERILVHDEYPIIPLYFYVISGLVKPHVKGFHSRLTSSEGSLAPTSATCTRSAIFTSNGARLERGADARPWIGVARRDRVVPAGSDARAGLPAARLRGRGRAAFLARRRRRGLGRPAGGRGRLSVLPAARAAARSFFVPAWCSDLRDALLMSGAGNRRQRRRTAAK